MTEWIAIGALAAVAVGIPIGMMALSALLRPSVPEQGKRAVYESGEVPTGGTRIRFNIQYYMVALLFVVFDIETVLIFPWTVIYRDAVASVGMARALVPMLAFIGVLVVGLVWAWRNGAVRWVRTPEHARGRARQRGDRTRSRGRVSDGEAGSSPSRAGGGLASGASEASSGQQPGGGPASEARGDN